MRARPYAEVRAHDVRGGETAPRDPERAAAGQQPRGGAPRPAAHPGPVLQRGGPPQYAVHPRQVSIIYMMVEPA